MEQNKIKHSAVGVVISDQREKTITVQTSKQSRHPVYGKYIISLSKFHVHDEQNQCKVGDKVRVVLGKPMSKTKSWHLVEIIEKAQG